MKGFSLTRTLVILGFMAELAACFVRQGPLQHVRSDDCLFANDLSEHKPRTHSKVESLFLFKQQYELLPRKICGTTRLEIDKNVVSDVSRRSFIPPLVAGIYPLFAFASRAFAADDLPEGELVDLPPPYVPVLLAVVILGGVGFLTNSLGDVISDEASLGERSGARAKKRNRADPLILFQEEVDANFIKLFKIC